MRPELPAAERAALEAILVEASGRFNFDDLPLCREPFALARMVITARRDNQLHSICHRERDEARSALIVVEQERDLLRRRLAWFEAVARIAAPECLSDPEKAFAALLQCGAR